MNSTLKERLRLVIAVALSVAPKRVKRAFADRHDPTTQDASRHLSEAVTEAVVRAYEVKPKPPCEIGAGALYRGPGEG